MTPDLDAGAIVLDAELTLAALGLAAGGDPRSVADGLLDSWGAPLAKAAGDGDDPTEPGSHGIPEIGRQERAFYEALNAGRKAAYDDLVSMVNSLFRRKKPFESLDPWRADEPLSEWKARALQLLRDEPAKAFALGGVLAAEFLEAARTNRPLLPTDRRAITYLEAYAFNEVDSKFEEMKGALRTALIQGVSEGRNPKEVARLLANELDDYDTDLKRIAITETARAENQGRLFELKADGYEFVVGSSAFDKRVCDWCKNKVNGRIGKLVDLIGKSNFGRRKKDWLPLVLPAHPFCRCLYLPFTGVPPKGKLVRVRAAVA